MRSRFLLLTVAVACCGLLSLRPAQDENLSSVGHLVVVGGGGTPEVAWTEALALTGVASPRVVVLPQASEREDRGLDTVAKLHELGVEHVDLLDPVDTDDAAARIEAADLIWMPGGDQERLMEALRQNQLTGVVQAQYAKGKVIGGTSAGAAVMSLVMISGPPDPQSLTRGAMPPLRGLGVWPDVIVDQHFVQRERFGRLLTAVLDRPRLVGIGIAERTAAIVHDRDLRVIGEGQVVIYDAREADVPRGDKGSLQAARGVKLHVLTPGESLRLID